MIIVARKLLIALNAMLKENRPFQDPPFEFMDGDNAQGFDVDLMQAIAAENDGLRQAIGAARPVCKPGVCFRS